MTFELLAHGYDLVEGPRVDAREHLYFSCSRTGVHRRDPDGAITRLVDRTWVGGIALHEDGGLLIGGKTLAHWNPVTRQTTDVFAEWGGNALPGVNDFTVNALGEVYIGVMGFDINVFDPGKSKSKPPPGGLYRVARSGEATQLFDGVMVPNGVAFSPDGRLLYQNDTMTHAVWVFDVAADGNVGDRRVFCRLRDDELPDGLAVDLEGGVWVAVARGDGEVIRIRPDGVIDRRIAVPSSFVTSLTFGGPDLTDLYVVTANNTLTPDKSGAVLRAKVDIPGLAVPLAGVVPAA